MRKIEPYLTFINIHQLESYGGDIQTKIEELEKLNQSLRQHNKVKDGAIQESAQRILNNSLFIVGSLYLMFCSIGSRCTFIIIGGTLQCKSSCL